jgi:hypothetical protein
VSWAIETKDYSQRHACPLAGLAPKVSGLGEVTMERFARFVVWRRAVAGLSTADCICC